MIYALVKKKLDGNVMKALVCRKIIARALGDIFNFVCASTRAIFACELQYFDLRVFRRVSRRICALTSMPFGKMLTICCLEVFAVIAYEQARFSLFKINAKTLQSLCLRIHFSVFVCM